MWRIIIIAICVLLIAALPWWLVALILVPLAVVELIHQLYGPGAARRNARIRAKLALLSDDLGDISKTLIVRSLIVVLFMLWGYGLWWYSEPNEVPFGREFEVILLGIVTGYWYILIAGIAVIVLLARDIFRLMAALFSRATLAIIG